MKDINVLDAIKRRHSNRKFLSKPVERHTIHAVLDHARFSPSGANLQPWQVYVLTGQSKKTLSNAIIAANTAGEPPSPEFPYYPENWFEPYRSRRFESGMALYTALGIDRKDRVRRQQQWQANYDFFGAPVGLLFCVDKKLGHGCYVDMGIFLQTIMLAAIGHGLATCAQASLGDYPDIVRRCLNIPEQMMVLGGMALGYADNEHPVNQYRLPRLTVDEFTTWLA